MISITGRISKVRDRMVQGFKHLPYLNTTSNLQNKLQVKKTSYRESPVGRSWPYEQLLTLFPEQHLSIGPATANYVTTDTP